MLWNVVYEFFVKYVFGGYWGDYSYESSFGKSDKNAYLYQVELNSLFNVDNPNLKLILPIGNYLSLIATIISMVAIVLICCVLIKKIYNMCAHIIG